MTRCSPSCPRAWRSRSRSRSTPRKAASPWIFRDNPDCIDAGLNLTEACATANCIQGVFENLKADIPPRGVRGGGDANHAYHGHLHADGSEDSVPNGVMLALAPGEFVRSVDNGGSGDGDPLTSEPARVLEDVVEGYVTRDCAESVYGVVIAGSADDGTLSVDEAATERYRSTWDTRAAVPPDARRSGQG